MKTDNETKEPFHVIVSTMRSGISLCGHLFAKAGWVECVEETQCSLDSEESFEQARAKIRGIYGNQRGEIRKKGALCDKVVSPWTLPDQGRYLAEQADYIYLLLRHPLAIWKSYKKIGGNIYTLEHLVKRLQTMRGLVERTRPEKLQVITYYELTSEERRGKLFGESLNSYSSSSLAGVSERGGSGYLVETEKIEEVTLEEDLARALPEIWMDFADENLGKALVEFQAIIELTQTNSLDVLVPEEVLARCHSLRIVEKERLTSKFVEILLERRTLPLSVSDCKEKGELPCEDRVFREIYSDDLVHRCSPEKTLEVLTELRRILEPEGLLTLSTIDYDWVFRLPTELTSEEEDWYLQQIPEFERELPLKTVKLIENYLHRSNRNRYLYQRTNLKELLEKAGFEHIREVASEENEPTGKMPAGLLAKERFAIEARRGKEPTKNTILKALAELDIEKLLEEVDRKKEDGTIILTIGNSDYLQVIENWASYLIDKKISNYLVIALDEELADHLANENIPHFFIPFDKDLEGFWRLRIALVSKILADGTGVIFSDADAIWLRDPRVDLIENKKVDLVFSQGTTWPGQAFNTWGFVMCCGFFYAAPTLGALELFGTLEQIECKRFDDQKELNLEVLRRGVTWQIEDPEVVKLDSDKELTCSRQRIVGISESLKIDILPYMLYQRPVIDTECGTVIHPLSPKKQLGTINTLLQHDLWKKGAGVRMNVEEAISQQGFWFVDVPRTSSSSIRAELTRRFGIVNGKHGYLEEDKKYAVPQVIPPHQTAAEMRDRLGVELWEKLFTFGFVRNPYERIWSFYCYWERSGKLPQGETFGQFVTAIQGPRRRNPNLSRSAFDFMSDKKGQIIVDRVCRFEDRDEELVKVGKKIKMKFTGLVAQRAAANKGHYREYYDQKSKRAIDELFAMDFELGGYSMEL